MVKLSCIFKANLDSKLLKFFLLQNFITEREHIEKEK